MLPGAAIRIETDEAAKLKLLPFEVATKMRFQMVRVVHVGGTSVRMSRVHGEPANLGYSYMMYATWELSHSTSRAPGLHNCAYGNCYCAQ